jgi:bifunctional non-homologous end joining protein LigD
MDKMVNIDGSTVKLTNLEKLLWPEDKITKAGFINYFAEIAKFILPHLKNRPMVFTRFPDGIDGKSFYQKNCPNYAPQWVKTIGIRSDKRTIHYILIKDIKTLIWVANQACVELHPWHSRVGSLNYPDYAIFDLDPMESTDFDDAVELAFAVKNALAVQGIRCYPKTSGATGLQVYVPLVPRYTYKQVRVFTQFFSTLIAESFPDKATVVRTVKDRGGKVYMDYLQNIKGKTIASVYSPRPRAGAPVSAPVTWHELDRGVTPQDFNINTMPRRLAKIGDVFSHMTSNPQNIDNILNALETGKLKQALSIT